jgi:long-chain acyl-CoA synthetase
MPCFVWRKKGNRGGDPSAEYDSTVVAYYAVQKLGAIAVMNNPLYTNRELEYQFNDSGSVVLVTVDLLANRMIELRPKTKIKQIVYTSLGDYQPFPKSIIFPLIAKKKGLLLM